MNDTTSGEPWFRRSTIRSGILFFLLLGCTALALYAGVGLRISVAYTHLFYIPIILSGLWYGPRGVIAAVYLGAVHITVDVWTQGLLDHVVLIRAIGFIAAGLLVGFISWRMQQADRVLLEYFSSYTRRLSSPQERFQGRFDGIRMSLGMNMDLERMRKNHNINGLVRALNHRTAEIRYQAADALGSLRPPEAVDALDRALRDSDPGIRWKAAEALGTIGPAALPALVRATEDPDEDVRWRAVLALGEIGGEETIRPLLHALADEDPYVQGRAILVLSRMGDPAVQPVSAVLFATDPRQQVAAAQTLEQIGDPEALDSLEKTLGDENQEVRSAAAAAIWSITKRCSR